MSEAELSEEFPEQTMPENDQASSAPSTENPFEEEIKAKEEDENDEEEDDVVNDEDLLHNESAQDWLIDQNGKNEKLSDKEFKRQHAIYDLYNTEKCYCLTLTVFKRIYLDAVIFNRLLTFDQSLRLIPDINSLNNLIRTHLRLLKSIKRRKIDRIEEVFLYHFTGRTAKILIDAYVKFLSRKQACTDFYNRLLKENANFKNYITEIYSNGFYKKLTFDDCLLLIAQRLSKYHQLIESIVKYTSSDYDFLPRMLEAEKAVKNLVHATDAGVGEIQMRELRRHIIQNFDHKSLTEYGIGGKFTINDLNSEIRTLLHTFQVQWSNAKGSSANVTLLIFSDVLVFVRKTSNGAYAFFSQDKKCSVVSLKKIHVTDKAGKQSGVYLMAIHPKPEMYEVKCKTKKENQKLIDRVKRASDQFSESVLEPQSLTTVSSDTLVMTASSDELWSGNELDALDSLFEKFTPINDKLADYYNDLFNFYGEIGSYAKSIASKVKNDDDRDQILDIVNKGFTAQTLALKNIEISNAWNELMKQSFEFLSNNLDEKSTESCVKFDTDDVSNEAETALDEPTSLENRYENDQTVNNDPTLADRGDHIDVEDIEKSEDEEEEDEEGSENNAKDSAVGETTSTFDSQIGRSNTFHYVRNCEKRKGIKKHPTVSGLPGADVKSLIPKIKIARSYDNQIAISRAAPPSSPDNCTLETLFKQISESQVTLQKLNQENLRLKLELAAYKERSRDKNFRIDNNNNNYNHARYSLPADNYSTLEEMRRLSTNLDEKRRDYTHLVDDKQFDLDKREKMLADREIQMERQVNELRGRWGHLHQIWEHHRLSGLPLAPMPPFLSFDMPMMPPAASIHGSDVRMPLAAPPSSNSDSSYVSAPSPGSSNDMKTVLEPSVMTNCSSNIVSAAQQQSTIQEYSAAGGGEISQRLPPAPFGFFPPPPTPTGYNNVMFAGAASGNVNVFRSPSFNVEVPPSLQGSLVHKGYLQSSNRKGVLPSKLSSGKHLTPAESFSSKLFSKKTTTTTLKNRPPHHSSSLEKIVDESTTAEISSKKK